MPDETTTSDVCRVCGQPRFAGIHAVSKRNGGHPFEPVVTPPPEPAH